MKNRGKRNTGPVFFITLTVLDWIDIFTKPQYFEILSEGLRFCVKQKSLKLYEYVFMTNHIHFIASAESGSSSLDAILRDFKRYTTNRIWRWVREDNRKYIVETILNSRDKKAGNTYQIWQQGNYPELIESEKFRNQKSQYIWYNPVKKGYVTKPEDWLYSSARQRINRLDPNHHEGILPCTDW